MHTTGIFPIITFDFQIWKIELIRANSIGNNIKITKKLKLKLLTIIIEMKKQGKLCHELFLKHMKTLKWITFCLVLIFDEKMHLTTLNTTFFQLD